MLDLRRRRPVAEHEAEGEVARVYHEIRQALRVNGINLKFRTWGGYGDFLPLMWDAVRPNVETRAFEDASDSLRAEAVRSADELGRLGAARVTRLGESQAYQVRAALDLYHYVNPKLLLLTSAVQLALEGELEGRAGSGEPAGGPAAPGGGAELVERGVPPRMYPMEMVEEESDDPRLPDLFGDIKGTLSLASINSDYRTLALWPDYLQAAWGRLKPVVQRDAYAEVAAGLRASARQLARELPHRIPLSRQRVEAIGEDSDEVTQKNASFLRLLPPLILNVALLELDWRAAGELERSPFPAAARGAAPQMRRREGQDDSERRGKGEAARSRRGQETTARTGAGARAAAVASRAGVPATWRGFQSMQRVVELGDRFLSYVDEGEGPPVVLIHGIPTWGYLWHGLLPTLAARHRVLIPDLLGFGYSDKSDRFDRSIARQAEAIEAWMAELGVEGAGVVGHDIGGGVALRLAALAPESVARLCLLNTVCYDSWPIELMLQFGDPATDRKLSASAAGAAMKQALKKGFGSSPGDELLEGLLAPYATETGKLSLVRDAAALNTNLTTELTPLLPAIAAPVLILWGEEDEFQRVEYGERLAWDIPGARLARVPGARHFVMLDEPEEVSAQLLAFLEDL